MGKREDVAKKLLAAIDKFVTSAVLLADPLAKKLGLSEGTSLEETLSLMRKQGYGDATDFVFKASKLEANLDTLKKSLTETVKERLRSGLIGSELKKLETALELLEKELNPQEKQKHFKNVLDLVFKKDIKAKELYETEIQPFWIPNFPEPVLSSLVAFSAHSLLSGVQSPKTLWPFIQQILKLPQQENALDKDALNEIVQAFNSFEQAYKGYLGGRDNTLPATDLGKKELERKEVIGRYVDLLSTTFALAHRTEKKNLYSTGETNVVYLTDHDRAVEFQNAFRARFEPIINATSDTPLEKRTDAIEKAADTASMTHFKDSSDPYVTEIFEKDLHRGVRLIGSTYQYDTTKDKKTQAGSALENFLQNHGIPKALYPNFKALISTIAVQSGVAFDLLSERTALNVGGEPWVMPKQYNGLQVDVSIEKKPILEGEKEIGKETKLVFKAYFLSSGIISNELKPHIALGVHCSERLTFDIPYTIDAEKGVQFSYVPPQLEIVTIAQKDVPNILVAPDHLKEGNRSVVDPFLDPKLACVKVLGEIAGVSAPRNLGDLMQWLPTSASDAGKSLEPILQNYLGAHGVDTQTRVNFLASALFNLADEFSGKEQSNKLRELALSLVQQYGSQDIVEELKKRSTDRLLRESQLVLDKADKAIEAWKNRAPPKETGKKVPRKIGSSSLSRASGGIVLGGEKRFSSQPEPSKTENKKTEVTPESTSSPKPGGGK